MSTQFSAGALAAVPAFAGLSPDDFDVLAQSFQQAIFPAGATIFRSGEQAPMLYVMVDGAVEIAIDVPDGNEAILASLGPKDVFGESTFFHPAPHGATARAKAPTTLLCLSRAEYERLLDSGSPAICRLAAKAAEILAARLQAADRWVAQLLGEEEVQIAASWRRFREGIGGSFDLPRGFVHPY
jgi:CRP/FNR family cyclic AMP-dependent transcriptional regulator